VKRRKVGACMRRRVETWARQWWYMGGKFPISGDFF